MLLYIFAAMYAALRNILFRFDPEKIHYWTMRQLVFAQKLPIVGSVMKKAFCFSHPQLQQELWGIKFPNPVGLAAGFDKDGKFTDALAGLGFGFIEIGTVTPRPQPGNPKPRLFRLPLDKGIINRMGFNNEGAELAARRLAHRKEKIIIGGNIGKNKDTPNEEAASDYISCFHTLYPVVDYFVVNVSSPNTPGLRALQDKEPLMQLLGTLQQLNNQKEKAKPILLKIAPDLTDDQLNDIISIVAETKIAGVVATNTTIERKLLTTNPAEVGAIGAGGLSGKPLTARSTEVIRYLHTKSKGAFPIIAVGGIFTAADAQEKLDAGAQLVQVYTGFIYEGPTIVSNICKGLLKNKQARS